MIEEGKVSRSLKDEDRAYLDDPPQPKLSGKLPRLAESRRVDGVRFFPPALPLEGVRTRILVVTGTVSPEEASAVTVTDHGFEIPRKPGLGKGPAAQIIKDAIDRFPEIHSAQTAFAALVPWLLPKNRRYKPTKEEIAHCKGRLREIVEELKPDVVLAFGKTAFDALTDFKISQGDARAGWFSTAGSNVPLYLLDNAVSLLTKPWSIDTLITDLKEVNRMLSADKGAAGCLVNSEVIDTPEALQGLVDRWRAAGHTCFSVDCEWKGTHHVDGKLRSIQFCWSDHDAAYLRFFDETGRTYLPYEEAGRILGSYLNEDGITYIGHHFAADSPWMEHVLGLKIHGRCVFDSEYAQQIADEYAPLGLEWMALRYTDFGRYDMDLVMWKRANKMGEDDGYGFIPDSILIPYALIDVVVVWRSRPPLELKLVQEDTIGYYRSIILPFVTDVFHGFVTTGLPVDRELFENTRRFMNWAYRVLLDDFRETLVEHANRKLALRCNTGPDLVAKVAADTRDAGNTSLAAISIKNLAALFGADPVSDDDPLLVHWLTVPSFNIRSHPQMSRWLFEVLGLEPVKSTSNKEQGIPAMLWEKVRELPPKAQAQLKPAVDKETIEILADQEPEGLLHRLLAVSNIGNQCKGFLKEGDRDADGELVRENGLAKFLASDNRIHGQFSLTETGRPRSWKPNTLNLSSYHNKGVEAGLARVLSKRGKDGRIQEISIPAEFADLFGSPEDQAEVTAPVMERGRQAGEDEAKTRNKALVELVKSRIPTVRSVVKADPQWVMTESDFKTAEIRSMAFVFGDPVLIRLMTEGDPSFALDKGGRPVRLAYAEDSGIPPENRKPELLMAWCEEGKNPVPVTEDDLMRDENGNLVHPPYDLHWSLAEMAEGLPRELLSNKKDRGSAKVANFSCVWGCAEISTSYGPVELRNINPLHQVWDGVEWVRHEGLQYQGKRQVITYKGLTATPEHVVWTAGGSPVPLIDAAWRGLELVAGDPGEPVRLHLGARYGLSDAEGDPLERRVSEMRQASHEMAAQLESGEITQVPVRSGRILQGQAGSHVGCQVSRDDPALLHGHPRFQPQLQGAGDQGAVQAAGVHPVGAGHVAGRDVPEQGLRPDRQRRPLQLREPEADFQGEEPEQHPRVEGLHGSTGTGVHEDAPGLPAATHPCPESLATEEDLGGDRGAGGVPCGPDQESQDRQTVREGGGGEEVPGGESGARGDGGPGDPPVPSGRHGAGDTPRECLESWFLAAGIAPPGNPGTAGLPGAGVCRGFRRVPAEEGDDRGGYFPPPCRETADPEDGGQEVRGSLPRHLRPVLRLPEAEGRDDVGPAGRGSWRQIPVEDVYDLINAGPRRRFTANGVIVSNCSYGAVATTLERRIYAQTGIRPESGTGEKLIGVLEKRQAVTFQGLDEVAQVPARGGTLRAASGRVRHFPIHSRELNGMPWRVRKAYLRAMGNEARNFYPQESVAATLAKACHKLETFYRGNGMKARVIAGLYDAIVTHSPLEERHVCARAHELFMDKINIWKYGNRYMSYPIDTEFNYRWSWRPSKADQKLLASKEFHPMDPGREKHLLGLLDHIEEMTHKIQPWIAGALNRV